MTEQGRRLWQLMHSDPAFAAEIFTGSVEVDEEYRFEFNSGSLECTDIFDRETN